MSETVVSIVISHQPDPLERRPMSDAEPGVLHRGFSFVASEVVGEDAQESDLLS